MNFKKQLKDGLVTQNPALVQLIGMCPLLAITTSMFNGIGMGIAVVLILTCSNIVIAALRKIIQQGSYRLLHRRDCRLRDHGGPADPGLRPRTV